MNESELPARRAGVDPAIRAARIQAVGAIRAARLQFVGAVVAAGIAAGALIVAPSLQATSPCPARDASMAQTVDQHPGLARILVLDPRRL